MKKLALILLVAGLSACTPSSLPHLASSTSAHDRSVRPQGGSGGGPSGCLVQPCGGAVVAPAPSPTP